jgi:adenine-specific DNA-methyltransferase
VDIDAQAVEVTKLSLLLKVLEGENGETIGKTRTLFQERALPDLGNNIKCGNSLIGSDFYAQRNLPQLTDEDDHRINAFDWKDAFAAIFENGGFDAIIGNPPWGANIDVYLEYYNLRYPSVTQQKTDSYKLFIGASLGLCKHDGLIGMIVPNTLLRQSRYQDVRTELLKCELRHVADLGENVFEGAIVPSCIFILKRKLKGANDFLFLDASAWKTNAEKEKHLSLSGWSVFAQTPAMAQNGLRDDTAASTILKIGECPFILLKDAGINYQRKNVGMSEKGKSDLADRLLYEADKKRDATDRMYWKGKDIDRYYVAPATRQFCRPNFKSFIKNNETVVLNEKYFAQHPKILIRQTADKPIAALDETGVWFGRSVIGISLAENSVVSREYVLAVLNSDLMEEFYQTITGEKGRGFAQVKLATIRQLPFCIPDFSKKDEKKAHDDITDNIRKIMVLTNRAAQGDQSAVVQKQIKGLVNQVNATVAKLFGNKATT